MVSRKSDKRGNSSHYSPSHVEEDEVNAFSISSFFILNFSFFTSFFFFFLRSPFPHRSVFEPAGSQSFIFLGRLVWWLETLHTAGGGLKT